MVNAVFLPMLLGVAAGIAASGALRAYRDYKALRAGNPKDDGYLMTEAKSWIAAAGAGIAQQDRSWWNTERTIRFMFQVRGLYLAMGTATELIAVPAGAGAAYQAALAATGSLNWALAAGITWMFLLTTAIFRFNHRITAVHHAVTMRMAGLETKP